MTKALQDLLYQVPLVAVQGQLGRSVHDFHFDSRQVGQDDVFVAVVGHSTDGHHYIDQAIARGAVAVVCQQMPTQLHAGVTYLQVANSAAALGYIASNYYDNPSRQLRLVGTTGTNGKTTTSTLLYELCNALGHKSGLISTVAIKVGDDQYPASLTTPDAKALHQALAAMVQAGCEYCFMEVSSIAMHQHRVTGLQFAGGIFTNLTHDHLDYHGTFAHYLQAKQSFFDYLPTAAFALTNADDRNAEVMLQNTRARRRSYGLQRVADYKAKLLENQLEGLLLAIGGQEVWFRLTGHFNAYNLLAVYAAAVELGLPSSEVLLQLSQLGGVSGRFQVFRFARGITGIVDYAHTPDALRNVLETASGLKRDNMRLICLFGCGGGRDHSKRPEMGRIAAELADVVILTSDNPRNEVPSAIIDEIEAGVPISQRRKLTRITDRREAIRAAAHMAQPGDILLLAGKGHETYQEVQGTKQHFDDSEELHTAFQLIN